jgi:glycosyltransferase involved in cell wall biosynthesis
MAHIAIVGGLPESLTNFRGHLISSLAKAGHGVTAMAADAENAQIQAIESLGARFVAYPLQKNGLNPWRDLQTFLALWKIFRVIKPDVILSYTIKPVIYGSVAAWLAGVPHRFALITGLGYAFQGQANARGSLRAIVQGLYGLALRCTHKVFFQNSDDQALFRSLGLLRPSTPTCVVNGSGVDVAVFAVTPLPLAPHFLLIARLLGDKGVREYAQAAQRIRLLYPHARFSLVGWFDENPDTINQTEVDSWVRSGTLEFLGRLSDVRSAIEGCSVYVLPSYREGTPRTVLEAMAMGRPIITTDAPGCRETVINGDNGLLVPVQSVDALVDAMACFIIDPSSAVRMGQRSRQLAEGKFDVHKVNAVIIKEMGLG